MFFDSSYELENKDIQSPELLLISLCRVPIEKGLTWSTESRMCSGVSNISIKKKKEMVDHPSVLILLNRCFLLCFHLLQENKILLSLHLH